MTLVASGCHAGIAFYCGALGFDLIEDTGFGGGGRWMRVAPKAGGRVASCLETGDFDRDQTAFCARRVVFVEASREVPHGTVAVFKDRIENL